MSRRYIALLRGINVGRAKRVAMADLRALLEGLGYTEVSTLLNSGNVVFSARDISAEEAAGRVESALAKDVGVSARVTVVTAEELADAIDGNPLPEVSDNPSRLLVGFVRSESDLGKLDPLTQHDWSPEALALGDRAAYLWCPDGIAHSPLAAAVDKVLGDAITSRNWTTVLKLQTIAEATT